MKAALQLLTRMRREQENSVDIRRHEHGRTVTCTIHDLEEPLMSLSLRVADDMQAGLVKEQFLQDPTLVYRSLLAILTGDAGWERQGNRIIIDLR